MKLCVQLILLILLNVNAVMRQDCAGCVLQLRTYEKTSVLRVYDAALVMASMAKGNYVLWQLIMA